MKTMKELYKALSIEDSLTTLESRFYEKEEIQNFIKELKENIVLEANKIQDLNQIVFENNNLIIYWDLLNLRATMPSKRDEDAGFDIYSDAAEDIILKPNETKFFSTGLRSAFPSNFWVEIKERGSTGAVGLSVRSGVIDSGYRGEWKIMLTNVNKYPVVFSHSVDKVTYVKGKIFKNKIKKVIYPLSKAIAQAVVIPLPHIQCKWDKAVVDGTKSDRGQTGWGASGK
jgi:dUTP pyrophosphatase